MSASQSQLAALQSVIKLIADAADDVVAAGGKFTTASLPQFSNLLSDVMALMPQVGSISLSGLATQDYVTLLGNVATDLALPAGQTANIVNASIKLLEDLASDIPALIAAIKPPAPAPAAPSAKPAA